MSEAAFPALTRESIKHIEEDVRELKDDRKEVFSKLDDKVNKSDLDKLTLSLDKVAQSVEDLRSERRSDIKWLIPIAITGVITICGFFWKFTNDIKDSQNAIDKRLSIVETQLKGFELVR